MSVEIETKNQNGHTAAQKNGEAAFCASFSKDPRNMRHFGFDRNRFTLVFCSVVILCLLIGVRLFLMSYYFFSVPFFAVALGFVLRRAVILPYRIRKSMKEGKAQYGEYEKQEFLFFADGFSVRSVQGEWDAYVSYGDISRICREKNVIILICRNGREFALDTDTLIGVGAKDFYSFLKSKTEVGRINVFFPHLTGAISVLSVLLISATVTVCAMLPGILAIEKPTRICFHDFDNTMSWYCGDESAANYKIKFSIYGDPLADGRGTVPSDGKVSLVDVELTEGSWVDINAIPSFFDFGKAASGKVRYIVGKEENKLANPTDISFDPDTKTLSWECGDNANCAEYVIFVFRPYEQRYYHASASGCTINLKNTDRIYIKAVAEYGSEHTDSEWSGVYVVSFQ